MSLDMKFELGKLGSTSDMLGQKDAFHAPCIMVQSLDRLEPGQYIKFLEKLNQVTICNRSHANGIVDPFLQFIVESNTKFWMLLNPGTVSNLTHNFLISKNIQASADSFEGECCEPEPTYVEDNDDDGCKAMGCA